MTNENLSYSTAAIRDLLATAFNSEELTTLCFDHFRPVYEDFGSGMSKSQMIQRLLDYCDRHGQFDTLLRVVETQNPIQYARFESRLRIRTSQPAPTPDLGTLRRRLNQRFDDPGLDALCLDHFPEVYDKFSEGMRRDIKINLLLDHVRRDPARWQNLLTALGEQTR